MTTDFAGHSWVMTGSNGEGCNYFSCTECHATKTEYTMSAKVNNGQR